MGARINFHRDHGSDGVECTGTDEVDPASALSPPTSPILDSPLASNGLHFAFPPSTRRPNKSGPSRFREARRKASVVSSRVTSSAARVWYRFIGRAHGNVVFTSTISDMAVILPHSNPAHPQSMSRPSIHDLKPQPHPQCSPNSGPHHRDSAKSLEAEKVKSTYSMERLFRRIPRYALPSHEGGYERLLALDGESRMVVSVKFGPRRGLLTEDTLSVETNLGCLHTCIGAWGKVQDLMKTYKEKKERKDHRSDEKSNGGDGAEGGRHETAELPQIPHGPRNPWDRSSLPRVVLRAFESFSLSLTQVTISHFLSVSNSHATSANSSATDLSSLGHEEYFTVSLAWVLPKIKLSAADSTNNDRARNAFGTNRCQTSRVRGVAFAVSWKTVELDCVAPGDSDKDKNQLLAIRNADFEGLSTWRPSGWTREELLFANDPNLALVVGRATIASVDAAGDVQLLNELADAWRATHPRAPADPHVTNHNIKSAKHLSPGLLPRLRLVLDVGHSMFVLADRVSRSKTTLSVSTGGLHAGCYTTYADLIGRRQDKSSTKTAFKEEEQLQQRRAEMGDTVDYALPDAMLKPRVRRKFHPDPATLYEDFTISMSFNANLELEPIAMHLTIEGDGLHSQETFPIASVGRAHGQITGDILGRNVPELADGARMDPITRSMSLDLGIDSGVHVNLWEKAVLDALAAMGKAHTGLEVDASPPPKPKADLLSRMPSGLSARISLGSVSVFVGQPDPNPSCDKHLVRGLWFRSFVLFEYAYYDNTAQTLRHRHDLTAHVRVKLKLPTDIATQALACYHHNSPKGGAAALFRFTLLDATAIPIFHGQNFDERGGMRQEPASWEGSKPPATAADFTTWEFIKMRGVNDLKSGVLANAVPELEETGAIQARRHLFRLKSATANWLVQRKSPEADIEHRLTGRSEPIALVCGLAHVYCAILAFTALKRVVEAWKRHRDTSSTGDKLGKAMFSFTVPSITCHLAFPLHEQLFIHIGALYAGHEDTRAPSITLDQALVYVPSASPREAGMWQELGMIKRLSVMRHVSDPSLPLDIKMEAMRVRIPVSYHVSRLVLNIGVSFKALKLIVDDLRSETFSTVKSPVPESPKNVPHMSFSIDQLALEAKDSPIEERLNLIWRVGLAEQKQRIERDLRFEEKVSAIERAEQMEESDEPDTLSRPSNVTPAHTVDIEEARQRLDWYNSKNWVSRINAAKEEQRRREKLVSTRIDPNNRVSNLPITIAPLVLTPPLVRASFQGVQLTVGNPGLSRDEIINYMGEVSTPFDPQTDFSLMVPMHLNWKMDSASVVLRDYPLPLIKIRPLADGSPAWSLVTQFIIAEELQGEDSVLYVPCEVVPAGLGSHDAKAFTVQIAKTISPVKTYTRPLVRIHADRTTEFTWGNSMQPAIQDLMKVVETLSHPPRDPSPRIGFWDKFRLILHWIVKVEFDGPVHLHLKGTRDPYQVVGHGAGFALGWKGNTQMRIGVPNEQGEVIQISADQLLIAIPDLTSLDDQAALGRRHAREPEDHDHEKAIEIDLISRRYTKPCARFMNGVRVGFGFKFERACRPHSCDQDCGGTDNLMHRLCRITHFKRHQDVILRSPEAVERDELKLGRTVDSYEGFRSDHVHFSVSLESPLKDIEPGRTSESVSHNSLHCTPKAFAHFFAWWRLFNSTLSLPIRQGKLFPASPPPSRKFGRSLGTIKYRIDLRIVYISHMYSQISRQLWDQGKSQSLGVKAKFGRFRGDMHQRAQEKVVRHNKLDRVKVVTHKPFYATDLILEDIEIKGIRAEFDEHPSHHHHRSHDGGDQSSSDESSSIEEFNFPKAGEMESGDKAWFNLFDFVDADKRPMDPDPRIELVDFGDCPEIFFSMRTKVQPTTPGDDDSMRSDAGSDDGTERQHDLERSKFGDEPTHVCYLRTNKSVAPIQIKITRERIRELQHIIDHIPAHKQGDLRVYQNRLKILHAHVDDLESKEKRHIDSNTFQARDEEEEHDEGESFQSVFHVHCPRIYYTNRSRNIAYQYWFSSRDRKREEYTTSHASLRGIRDGIERRMKRTHGELSELDERYSHSAPSLEETAVDLLKQLAESLQSASAGNRFKLPVDHKFDHVDLRQPSLGLPKDCTVKPVFRFLLLKPQITFRSEADTDAIVLLAVEEFSLKSYSVLDQLAKDDVVAKVLTRNYGSMKGLQAFYPNEQTLARERQDGGLSPGLRQVPALPLEIFLDVRSEATDYDRIILKTDAAVSVDRFNHLRMPRGLQWPDAKDEYGDKIKHLKVHMDQTAIIVPRITLSATSKHYSALYCVVTDLLMYQDPEHRHRSEQINDFIFAFDRKDRDPDRLLADIHALQSNIRYTRDVVRGYEQNMDQLNEEGKFELFRIRNDLLSATEQLFTVFEVITVNFNRDDAMAALKTASKLDVRAGGIAWHLLHDDFKPLVKIDIDGTMMSMLHNKDGSVDVASVVNDLCALNSNAECAYPEIVVRYEPSGTRKKTREPIASVIWSTLAAVGGIPIVRQFTPYIHPIRLQLEEQVGHEVMDYIFNDRVRRRREEGGGGGGGGTATPRNERDRDRDASSHAGSKTASTLELAPLHRSKSAVSVASSSAATAATRQSRQGDEGMHDHFTLVPKGDAAEMRRRANSARTFLSITFEATSFVLSYKSDDRRKHRTFTFPDMVDFKVKTPQINYKNKVCSFEDVFEAMKKDTKNGIWEQSGDIFTQIIKRTSVFRSKKGLKSLALHSEPIARPSSLMGHSPSSRLKFHVEAPTPSGDDEGKSLDANLSRALTSAKSHLQSHSHSHDKESNHGHSHSPGTHNQTLGSPIARVVSRLSQSGGSHIAPTSSNGSSPSERERERDRQGITKSPSSPLLARRDPETPDSLGADEPGSDHEGVGVGRAVKGFIGKFKRNHDSPDGSTSRKTSSHDDVPHFASVGRLG